MPDSSRCMHILLTADHSLLLMHLSEMILGQHQDLTAEIGMSSNKQCMVR